MKFKDSSISNESSHIPRLSVKDASINRNSSRPSRSSSRSRSLSHLSNTSVERDTKY